MNDKVIKIEEIKNLAQPIIKIPDFSGTGFINVRVQKPKIFNLASQGKIPNHLLQIATTMISGRDKDNKIKDEELLAEMDKTVELYCLTCLVEPTYDELRDYITDDQKLAIFNWAIGEVNQLDSFRNTEGNDNSHTDGETL